MSTGGLSKARLGRMHDIMTGYVERGEVPGMVTLVSRRGEVHVDVIGTKALGSSFSVPVAKLDRLATSYLTLTGYLGGATATHVRVGADLFPVLFPIILGVLIWLGLYLRDDRLRTLIPLGS